MHSDTKEYFTRVVILFFVVCSVITAIYVLFVPPRPGVADQGDFQRVMDVTGLKDKEIPKEELDSLFFKYVKSEYIMTPVSPLRFFGIIPTTSMIYPITAAKILCRIFGSEFFNTEVLAFVYAVMYITALALCIKWLAPGNKALTAFSAVFSLFILLDGNYLVWFNSLYGEPMMIIGLMLFAASVLNISNKMGSVNRKDLIFAVISSVLFLGSKAQCISALPIVIIMLVRIFSLKYKRQRYILPKKVLFPIILIVFYTLGFYIQINSTCGVDTKYNTVFYGILKDSENPEKDLEMLGLNTDMAVEAGKHAYLPSNQYEKYAPWSDLTLEEFNRKISYFKIIGFYLRNPGRLIKGMEYTASQSFQTATSLGKYKKTDVAEYTYLFGRLTFWSDLRSRFLPKKLLFIVTFYVLFMSVTAAGYIKTRSIEEKLKTELIWFIAVTGIFQFPMPYLGNGQADTAKQLFLFNFTLDILIILALSFILQSAARLMEKAAKTFRAERIPGN